MMQNLCFGPECTISRYRTSGKKFRYEHTQFTSLDPKWCLRVFRSISQTFGMKNYAKLVFPARMLYFGVPNFRKKVSLWTHPIYFIRPKMMLESVSDHFTNFRHEKLCKTCVWARMHYFGVLNSRIKFRYEGTTSTPKCPKRRLGVFRCISQTFTRKNYAKHVFRPWMHYFRVSNSQKNFRYERTQFTS